MASKGKTKRPKYDKYKQEQKKEKNKIKFLEKYLKKSPNDEQAKTRVEELKAIVKINKV